MKYKIMGQNNGSVEEIDEVDSQEEALRLVEEYSIAFGKGWSIFAKPTNSRD